MDPEQERRVVEQLRASLGPGLAGVYLFGSAARGEQRPDSDVDLAVLAERPLEAVRRFEVAQELAMLLHRDVDLVDLLTAPDALRGEIVATGRRIHVADEVVLGEFEARALAGYARLHEESREVIAAFDERYRT